MLKSLYQYREFLKTNVKKDIRGKYKGSFLGILWSFINPLLMALVYAIVFPFILKSTQDNYVTFMGGYCQRYSPISITITKFWR